MPTTRTRAGGARPEPLFKPPPEQQPLAARMRPRIARRVRRPGAPRRRARAAAPERSPAATSPRSCSGDRRGPARPASPGCSRTRSAPISRRCRRSCPASSRFGPTIAEAQDRLALNQQRTVLFLDEIHRFNKAQQDALLPHVEDGTITLIGATTENPYFEVNSALLSRMRVWRLEPLDRRATSATVVRRALADEERGLAGAFGPEGGVAARRRRLRPPRLARRRRRPRGAQRARGRGRAGRGRGRPRQRRPRRATARGHRGGRPAADPRLRPGRRRPLRHRVGVHQEPARQRPRRGALLARGDDRRRRGPEVHRPAPDHQRVSEDVGNADPRALQVAVAAARRSTGSACRRRSTRWPRRPSTSRRRRSRDSRRAGVLARRWPT